MKSDPGYAITGVPQKQGFSILLISGMLVALALLSTSKAKSHMPSYAKPSPFW